MFKGTKMSKIYQITKCRKIMENIKWTIMDNLCHPWKCQGDGDGHKINNYIHILLRLVLPIMLFLFEWDTSVCTILKI